MAKRLISSVIITLIIAGVNVSEDECVWKWVSLSAIKRASTDGALTVIKPRWVLVNDAFTDGVIGHPKGHSLTLQRLESTLISTNGNDWLLRFILRPLLLFIFSICLFWLEL